MGKDTSAKASVKAFLVCDHGLNHDGEDYAIGDTIELTDKQAEPLLKVNVISVPVEAKAAAPSKKASEADKKTEPDSKGKTADKTSKTGSDQTTDTKPPAQ